MLETLKNMHLLKNFKIIPSSGVYFHTNCQKLIYLFVCFLLQIH